MIIKFKYHNGKWGEFEAPVTIRVRSDAPCYTSVLDAKGKPIERVQGIELSIRAGDAAPHVALIMHDINKKPPERTLRVDAPIAAIEPDRIHKMLPRVRRSVRAFAALMESRLLRKDHRGKSGWDREDCRHLFRRLKEEVQELDDELGNCPWWRKAQQNLGASPTLVKRGNIAREAADVANFAMMIVDRVAKKVSP